MIDFRYHLVSIIAVFFALAAGIVLGAGPLKGTVDDTLAQQTAELRDENKRLHEQLTANEANQKYQELFVQEVTPRLVSGQLEGRGVAVIALPGAQDDTVKAIREALEQAGATADLVVQIDPSWADRDSEPVLDQLASDLVTSGTELPESGDGFARGATVLAAALMAESGGVDLHETVDTAAVTAFQDAGLIVLDSDASEAPTLAVLVAGPVSGDDAQDRLGRLMTLTASIDTASDGTVTAGPPSTAESGLLATIRGDDDVSKNVSTVDSADLPSGRVAVVFALSEQQVDKAGQYGVVGDTDGALPPLPEIGSGSSGDTQSGAGQ